MKIFNIILISLAMAINSYSANIYAITTGNWENTSSWSDTEGGSPCNCVPTAGDNIYIPSGYTISVTSNINISAGLATYMDISGTLYFKNGVKLRLNCNSVIELRAGGKIQPAKPSGSNNLIEICGETVWKASDGTLEGPVTIDPEALPINLVKFDIEIEQGKVNIIWETASELNNDFFTIERSLDGYNFEKIQIIEGAGNSNQTINYIYEDQNPIEGILYYRLKQTDFNNDYTYSKVVAVNYKLSKESLFIIFPNPVSINDDLFISFEESDSDKEVMISAYNVLGELLYSKLINKGISVAVDLNKHLPAGTYIITATFKNKVYNNKLIIRA